MKIKVLNKSYWALDDRAVYELYIDQSRGRIIFPVDDVFLPAAYANKGLGFINEQGNEEIKLFSYSSTTTGEEIIKVEKIAYPSPKDSDPHIKNITKEVRK